MPRSILFGVLGFAAGAAASAAVVIGLLPAAHEPAAIATAPPAEGPAEPPAAPVAAPPAAPPCEVQALAPPLPVAPPPRDPADTRCYRSYFEDFALPAGKTSETEELGVQWRVWVGTRRLVSTGRDLIEFHWGVKYSGPRPPLIMQRPAFTDGWPGSTRAEFFAFPPGAENGRRVILPDPNDWPAGFSPIRDRPNPEWFLTAAREQWENGRDAIPVADIKAVLQARFPREFPNDRPPKLYTQLFHRALLRDADAWTGELESKFLEVPDLKSW